MDTEIKRRKLLNRVIRIRSEKLREIEHIEGNARCLDSERV